MQPLIKYIKEADNNTKYTPVVAKTLKETEKAFQLELQYWTRFDTPIKTTKMWVPKSCCKTEGNKVVEIAEWVLNKWATEHNEYIRKNISGYAANRTSLSFNMAEKERLINNDNAKKQKYQDDLKYAMEVIYNEVKDAATFQMQGIGYVSYAAVEAHPEWFTAEEAKKLTDFGKRVEKDFGKSSEMRAIDKNLKTYTSEEELKHMLYLEAYGTGANALGNGRIGSRYTGIKDADGNFIDTNTIWAVTVGPNGYEDSMLCKKYFHKNVKYWKEFKELVGGYYIYDKRYRK